MNWYNIELEILFYGKEFELTEASNEEEEIGRAHVRTPVTA